MQVLLESRPRRLALERDDHARHLLDDQRRDAFQALVEQHQIGAAHQRAATVNIAAAAAHAAARSVGHRREIGEERVDLVLAHVGAPARAGWRATARFSRTVRSVKMRWSSGNLQPRPRRPMRYGGGPRCRGRERDPTAGAPSAHDRFIVVDLLAPFLPTRATHSPLVAERDAIEHPWPGHVPGIERLIAGHGSAPPNAKVGRRRSTPAHARVAAHRRRRPSAISSRRAPAR